MLKKLILLSSLLCISYVDTAVAATPTAQVKKTFSQTGIASWYGRPFHGRKTASGEVYNMHSLTAAHRTLPFGTKLKVTSPSTGKSVIVKVNDRGPFKGNRIIDVSYAAAQQLGIAKQGLAKVKIEKIK